MLDCWKSDPGFGPGQIRGFASVEVTTILTQGDWLVFLALNGFDLDAPENDFAEMVLAVARSELDKLDVAVFIRRHTQPV